MSRSRSRNKRAHSTRFQFTFFLFVVLQALKANCKPFAATVEVNGITKTMYSEQHRPHVHFSLPSNWMNDPNGLVYANGVFHLFYQYNPYSTIWGPMHWGHAISSDLIHWENLPIALSPNEFGTIFSGCALVDDNNVTGLQEGSTTKPLVAIFTQHLENESYRQLQRQCLAYSLDNGHTWHMHDANPILDNPGIFDFRDPKVFKYDNHYILVLAAGDRVIFYRSYNLLQWEKLSEFGANHGSHDGVWECPDLFPLQVNGREYWILLVSINPGGPNGGSATQYFVGNFDGEKFENYYNADKSLWIDYGPDCYAGITWFGTNSRNRCFIGWMNNWSYGNIVPTDPWRGQMTIPRSLSLRAIGDDVHLVSNPVPTLTKLHDPRQNQLCFEDVKLNAGQSLVINEIDYPYKSKALDIKLVLDINHLREKDYFELYFGNSNGEYVVLSYSNETKEYQFDRSNTREVSFSNDFTRVAKAPRVINDRYITWRVLFDSSSVELFADEGLSLLTSLYYSQQPLNEIHLKFASDEINSQSVLNVKSACFYALKNIWLKNE